MIIYYTYGFNTYVYYPYIYHLHHLYSLYIVGVMRQGGLGSTEQGCSMSTGCYYYRFDAIFTI